jgi:hypothetical protein
MCTVDKTKPTGVSWALSSVLYLPLPSLMSYEIAFLAHIALGFKPVKSIVTERKSIKNNVITLIKSDSLLTTS